jgi:hypothetical protein
MAISQEFSSSPLLLSTFSVPFAPLLACALCMCPIARVRLSDMSQSDSLSVTVPTPISMFHADWCAHTNS